MATKFKFEIESDGLTAEQAQTFSAFVNSLKDVEAPAIGFYPQKTEVKTAAVPDMAAIFAQEKILKEGIAKHDTPAKKRRAPKFEVPESPGVIEPTPGRGDTEIDEAATEEAYHKEVAQKAEEAQKAKDLIQEKPAPEEAAAQETEEAVFAAEIRSITLDVLKKLVSAKQANHRDEIKAYFAKRDGARTSTLPDEFYQEFFDLLTAMA